MKTRSILCALALMGLSLPAYPDVYISAGQRVFYPDSTYEWRGDGFDYTISDSYIKTRANVFGIGVQRGSLRAGVFDLGDQIQSFKGGLGGQPTDRIVVTKSYGLNFSYLPAYRNVYAVFGGWYIHADSTESGTELGAPFERHKVMNDFSGEIGMGVKFKPVSVEITRLNHVYVRESPCCGPEYRQFFMLRANYSF